VVLAQNIHSSLVFLSLGFEKRILSSFSLTHALPLHSKSSKLLPSVIKHGYGWLSKQGISGGKIKAWFLVESYGSRLKQKLGFELGS
jgi:hypothetical protein